MTIWYRGGLRGTSLLYGIEGVQGVGKRDPQSGPNIMLEDFFFRVYRPRRSVLFVYGTMKINRVMGHVIASGHSISGEIPPPLSPLR